MGVKITLADPTLFGASATLNTAVLNGTNDKYGFVFRAPRSGGIVSVGIFVASSTLVGTVKVGIESVVAGGVPNAAATYVGTEATVTSLSAGWNWLTVDANAVADTYYAATVRITAYTSGTLTLNVYPNGYGNNKTPHAVSALDGAGWTIPSHSRPIFACLFDDVPAGAAPYPTNFAFGGAPISAISTSVSINDGTTPDEVGVKFVAPCSGEITALTMFGLVTAAPTGASTLTLYDDADASLGTVSIDLRYIGTPATAGKMFLRFNETPPALSVVAGRTYRLTYKGPAGDTTNSLRLERLTLADPGGGAYVSLKNEVYGVPCLTSRTNSGAWTDDESVCLGFIPHLENSSTGVETLSGSGGVWWW